MPDPSVFSHDSALKARPKTESTYKNLNLFRIQHIRLSLGGLVVKGAICQQYTQFLLYSHSTGVIFKTTTTTAIPTKMGQNAHPYIWITYMKENPSVFSHYSALKTWPKTQMTQKTHLFGWCIDNRPL